MPPGYGPTGNDRGGGRVLENLNAFPRAWVAYGARHAGGEQEGIDATLASSRGALLREPVVEDDTGLPARAPAAATPARVLSAGRQDMRVRVNARRRGVLVTSDSWTRDWRAKVDGRDVPVHPANGMLRAVAVPAGRHTVELSYRPVPLLAGALISLLAAVAVLGGIGLLTLRR